MSSIYIETIGSGTGKPDMVMLHGWAMHGGLMKGLAEELSDQFCVHLVDLPGHGHSQLNGTGFDITSIANEVFNQVSVKVAGKATWLGWSLGGLVATMIAELFPQQVSKLVLLASTPAFVKQSGWDHAVDKQVFENFASDLQKDLQATITRFLSLQVRGTEDSRQTLKILREIVFARDIASEGVLREGLGILEQIDLRNSLHRLTMPALLLGGERDTLVPQSALITLANNNGSIKTSIIEKAGHALFLSHPQQCAKAITGFCHD